MRRGIHTIRLKISIPKELKDRHVTLGVSQSQKVNSKQRLYTDDEIKKQIDHLYEVHSRGSVDITLKANDTPNYTSSLIDYLAPKKGYPYLPLYFLKNNRNIPTPYEKLAGISSSDSVTRLSVTKIIPFSYCELKKMYELYKGVAIKETEIMKMGSSVHRELEVNVHPQKHVTLQNEKFNVVIEVDSYSDDDVIPNEKNKSTPLLGEMNSSEIDIIEYVKSNKHDQVDVGISKFDESDTKLEETCLGIVEDEQFEEVKSGIDIKETTKIDTSLEPLPDIIPSSVIFTDSKNLEGTQHYKLNESIKRSIELLVHGRCREIPTHGYFSPSISRLVLPPTRDSIVISGIVDDLKITSEYAGAVDEYKEDLNYHLSNAVDFDSVIETIQNVSANWTDSVNSMLYILVNDDKTRLYRKKPATSINKTNMLQVGIYRRLLGLQASDPANSFLSWLRNMEDRQLDLYQAMKNDIVTLCCMTNNMYLHDCLKLKNGESLKFDLINFTPSNEPYEFQNASNDPKLDVLNGEWKFSPNLAHICARLAQVQGLLKPFLHENLQVTYLTKERELIEKVDGKYDQKFVDNQIDLGMQLWLGEREPVPTNTAYLCNRCEFKDICQVPAKRIGSV